MTTPTMRDTRHCEALGCDWSLLLVVAGEGDKNELVQGPLAWVAEEKALHYQHPAAKIETREHFWPLLSDTDRVLVTSPHHPAKE